MKTKRILSAALSAAMALSLATSAFAAEGGDTTPNTQTVISGAYQEAVIAVDVPETGTAFINPYGLGTTVTKSDDTTVAIKGQIATAPLYIVNNSDLDLDVGASITPALGAKSTMKLATSSTLGTPDKDPDDADYVAPATAKSAYVIVQGVASTVTTTDGDVTGDTPQDAIKTAYGADATWTSAVSSAALTVSSTGTAKAVTVDKFATLKAATLTAGEVSKHNAGSIMLYRLTGDCVKAPKEAWTADDTFTVKIAFTFSPAAPAVGG